MTDVWVISSTLSLEAVVLQEADKSWFPFVLDMMAFVAERLQAYIIYVTMNNSWFPFVLDMMAFVAESLQAYIIYICHNKRII